MRLAVVAVGGGAPAARGRGVEARLAVVAVGGGAPAARGRGPFVRLAVVAILAIGCGARPPRPLPAEPIAFATPWHPVLVPPLTERLDRPGPRELVTQRVELTIFADVAILSIRQKTEDLDATGWVRSTRYDDYELAGTTSQYRTQVIVRGHVDGADRTIVLACKPARARCKVMSSWWPRLERIGSLWLPTAFGWLVDHENRFSGVVRFDAARLTAASSP